MLEPTFRMLQNMKQNGVITFLPVGEVCVSVAGTSDDVSASGSHPQNCSKKVTEVAKRTPCVVNFGYLGD